MTTTLLINQSWRKFQANIIKRSQDCEPQYIPFAFFILIYDPLSMLLWHDVSPRFFTNIPIILVSIVLSLGLLLKNYWPARFKPFLSYYWYITILYTIPFVGTYLLLRNHVSTDWLISMELKLLVLYFLVDWLSFVFLLLIGTGLAVLTIFLFDPSDLYIASIDLSFALYMYGFVILVGSIFAHNKERGQHEKLKAIKGVGASIAHELRTPLLTISSGASGLQQYMPYLIEAYQLAKQAGLNVKPIKPQLFETLITALDDIEEETHYANTIINMLLIKVNQPELGYQAFETCSMSACVDNALRRYPFSGSQSRLVNWESSHEILFRGKELLMIHVLFNLLKNALYYIEQAGNGEIFIWSERKSYFNFFHFKDTGKGIPAQVLPRIFDSFYTTTTNGTGIGLAFCKYVLKGFGGDIYCQSVENEYTEFVLKFPVIAR